MKRLECMRKKVAVRFLICLCFTRGVTFTMVGCTARWERSGRYVQKGSGCGVPVVVAVRWQRQPRAGNNGSLTSREHTQSKACQARGVGGALRLPAPLPPGEAEASAVAHDREQTARRHRGSSGKERGQQGRSTTTCAPRSPTMQRPATAGEPRKQPRQRGRCTAGINTVSCSHGEQQGGGSSMQPSTTQQQTSGSKGAAVRRPLVICYHVTTCRC